MEFDEYRKIFQKDVNNYVVIDSDGHYKSKGAYVKKLTNLDYDLPIVNKAMVDYMVKNVPIEQTINECTDLKMFQKIVKRTGKFRCVWHNGKSYDEKCFRVFASLDSSDTFIGKHRRHEESRWCTNF